MLSARLRADPHSMRARRICGSAAPGDWMDPRRVDVLVRLRSDAGRTQGAEVPGSGALGLRQRQTHLVSETRAVTDHPYSSRADHVYYSFSRGLQ